MPRQLAHWTKEFNRLSPESDAEIYRELSRKVLLKGLRRVPGTRYSIGEGAADHARLWLDRKLSDVKKRICGNSKLRQLIARGDYAERDLFFVLVDILSSLAFYVPVGTVAMILARGGLQRLCGFSVKPKKRKGGKA